LVWLSEFVPLVVASWGLIRHRMYSIATELRTAIFAVVGVLCGLGVAALWPKVGVMT